MTEPANPTTQRWPLLVYLCAGALAVLAHAVLPLPWLRQPLSDLLFAAGWLVWLAAGALIGSSIRAMRRAGTTVNPNGTAEHLVTTGAFAITRNPIYLGFTLVLIGAALVSGMTWFLPFALLAAFVTQKIAIESEEKRLGEKFGKRYREYAKRVRRWV